MSIRKMAVLAYCIVCVVPAGFALLAIYTGSGWIADATQRLFDRLIAHGYWINFYINDKSET